MTTKEKILESALQLFNEEGVEKITTRHIAIKVGMSQGNLHYHFANKDIVILTLFKCFLEELQSARRYLPDNSFVKEEVFLSMKGNFKIMFEYRFLFKDNEIIWRRLPALKEQLIAVLSVKKNEISELISEYKENEIFRQDISSDQCRHLADLFMFTITSWLSAYEYLEKVEDIPSYYARFIFRLWLPYLKSNEMQEWEKLINNGK